MSTSAASGSRYEYIAPETTGNDYDVMSTEAGSWTPEFSLFMTDCVLA